MAVGDVLNRGPDGARRALRSGDRALAVAVLAPVGGWLARNARALLDDGRDADALTLLDRTLDPKWSSEARCQDAYRKAMTGKAKPFMENPL